MLTDESPYGAEDSIRILSSILSKDRPTPERRGYLVGPWEAEIRRAVALNPGERHKDASLLYQALSSTLEEAEAISRSSQKPQGPGHTVVVGPLAAEESRVPTPTGAGVPLRSTTVPNTSIVFPSVFPSVPPKPRGKAPLAAGLAIAAVAVGVGVLAMKSFRSDGEASPVPSTRATGIARPAHATDAGALAVPSAASAPPSSASGSGPVPPARELARDEGAPGNVRPRRVESGSKSGHAPPPAPSGTRQRLAPTSSFE
jgi:hypothetical protein